MLVEERTRNKIRALSRDVRPRLSRISQSVAGIASWQGAQLSGLDKCKFPNKSPPPPLPLEEEEGVEIYLENPLDSAPLQLPFKGWVQPMADDLRVSSDSMRALPDLSKTMCSKTFKKTHSHSRWMQQPHRRRCNWGENRRGLVYGMVQSGKRRAWGPRPTSGAEQDTVCSSFWRGTNHRLISEQDRVNQALNHKVASIMKKNFLYLPSLRF